MKVINPIGRTIESDTDANYGGIGAKGGCTCHILEVMAVTKGINFLCIGCRSTCFSGDSYNYVVNQELAKAKTIMDPYVMSIN